MFRMGTLISVYAELSKKNVTPVYVADLNLRIRGAVALSALAAVSTRP